jgi:hypothetical protein
MTELSYFAVVDPLSFGRMTFWRRVQSGRDAGRLVNWPKPNNWHPLHEQGALGWTAADRRRYAADYYAMRRDMFCEIAGAILAHPEKAAAAFAGLTNRCCVCGRPLRSEVGPVDPRCRQQLSPALLERLAGAIAHADAEWLRTAGVA